MPMIARWTTSELDRDQYKGPQTATIGPSASSTSGVVITCYDRLALTYRGDVVPATITIWLRHKETRSRSECLPAKAGLQV